MNEVKVKVGGMNCNHCKISVETGLKRISGIHTAIADIINGEVTIRGENINLNNVKTIVENLGYSFHNELK